jgi:hypothetical protein
MPVFGNFPGDAYSEEEQPLLPGPVDVRTFPGRWRQIPLIVFGMGVHSPRAVG